MQSRPSWTRRIAAGLLVATVTCLCIARARGQAIVAHTTLSSFSGGVGDGSIRAGTTWAGQVTQNASSITIGGTARDDNGWGITGLSLDVSAFGYLNIVAQRNPGNNASSLFLQLEDRFLNTYVVSIDTSLFTAGSPGLVQASLGTWPSGFDATQVTGWNIGGGGVGTMDFRMTLQSAELTTLAAIPEPAGGALMGAVIFSLVVMRRLKKRSFVPRE